MNIVIFDTETTSLEKPFCYNIGYSIRNEYNEVLCEKDFVVEQIWHNLPLFSTAYYAEKRPIYVARMKARKVRMDKFGYICREMARDFAKYEVKFAYAYNSSFDEKVFNFNCDWFKCNNPFENIPVFDIRGFVHNFMITTDFYNWCETHQAFTESENYSTTAETIFRYLTQADFEEEHTALADSQIEAEILFACTLLGADLTVNYPTMRSIKRKIKKEVRIDTTEKVYTFKYDTMTISKDRTKIKIR